MANLAPDRACKRILSQSLLFDALQAPFQKIDLQRLLPDLALQLGNAPFRPAPLPMTGKGGARPLPELTAPAMQQVVQPASL